MKKTSLHERTQANAAARFYFAGLLTTAILSTSTILAHRSEGMHTLLFGLTAQRLALLLIPCSAGLLALACFVQASQNTRPILNRLFTYTQQIKQFHRHTAAFLIFGTLMMIPSARFMTWAAIYERLKPLLFLFCGWGLTGVFAFSKPIQRTNLRQSFAQLATPTFWFFLALHGAFILFAFLSGYGIRSEAESWYEFSIPVLLGQAWAWVVCVVFLLRLRRSIPRFQPPKVVIFFTIWAISACVFCLLPTHAHYFAPGPYPPAYQFYPYSDAIFNDFAARTAGAGYGFSLGRTVLKPFPAYVFFLLQLLTGDNVNAQLLLQSAVFGAVPALLYLFGNELLGTPVGLLSAGFRVFQELNAQQSQRILTIHSRLEMTEWIAELVFLLFAWMIFRAIRARSTKKSALYATAAGSVLAAGIYTRANFFAFLPAAVFFFFLMLWKRKRVAFTASVMLIVTLALAMLPWGIRSYRNTGEILPEVFGTYRAVILGERFKPTLEDDNSDANLSADASNVSTEPQPVDPTIRTEISPESTEIPLIIETAESTASVPPIQSAADSPARSPRSNTFIESVLHHSVRNVISLFFIPPTSFEFQSLDQTFSDSDSPWLKSWSGQVSIELFLSLAINIVIFGIAASLLYHRNNLSGLNIYYWAIVYAVSLGLSRTSGGRYVVPMNWIGSLLFAAGISPFFKSQSSGETSENRSLRIDFKHKFSRANFPGKNRLFKRFFAPIFITLFFGLSFWTMIGIEKYFAVDAIPAVKLETIPAMNETIDIEQLSSDLESAALLTFSGKVLYPRFYYYQTGETGADIVYKPKEYSRLVFRLMNKAVDLDVLLPLSVIPDGLEPGDTVTVFGCREAGAHYMDGLLVVKTDAEGNALLSLARDPGAPLRCPSREPICPEANNCY